MKEKQLSGSHGRMSEPSQHIVVSRKRMSKPYVPYGMQRYRIGFLTDHSLPPGREWSVKNFNLDSGSF